MIFVKDQVRECKCIRILSTENRFFQEDRKRIKRVLFLRNRKRERI